MDEASAALLMGQQQEEEFAAKLTLGSEKDAPHDGGAAFAAYLAARKPQIERHLYSSLPQPAEETLAYACAGDLTGYLYEPVARFTAEGGKRTRPALALLGAEAVGADPMMAISAAAAIELFQTAALIHDDIADGGTTRRGKPCLHLTEGIGPAINAGDLALVSVSDTLLRDTQLDDATLLRVFAEFTYLQQRTLEGQALDLCWARDGRWDLSEDDYLAMATLKTAHYTAAAPLAIGAICGKGADDTVEELRSFGLEAGLAFQITDDLLNLEPGPAAQDKDWRSDISEGKRTLVAVHALGHLPAAERAELQALLTAQTNDPAQLARAVELMEQAGSLAYAHARAAELAQRACERLYRIELAAPARTVLLSMADFFVNRTL